MRIPRILVTRAALAWGGDPSSHRRHTDRGAQYCSINSFPIKRRNHHQLHLFEKVVASRGESGRPSRRGRVASSHGGASKTPRAMLIFAFTCGGDPMRLAPRGIKMLHRAANELGIACTRIGGRLEAGDIARCVGKNRGRDGLRAVTRWGLDICFARALLGYPALADPRPLFAPPSHWTRFQHVCGPPNRRRRVS
jgi:hypothetical protein